MKKLREQRDPRIQVHLATQIGRTVCGKTLSSRIFFTTDPRFSKNCETCATPLPIREARQ